MLLKSTKSGVISAALNLTVQVLVGVVFQQLNVMIFTHNLPKFFLVLDTAFQVQMYVSATYFNSISLEHDMHFYSLYL